MKIIKINIPIQHIENDLRVTVTDEVKDGSGGILDYFEGRFKETGVQEALTHAKMYSGIKSETGIADIELFLGSKIADKEDHEVNGSIKILIPTGKKPQGDYLFEPVIGNGRHFGLGAKIDGSANIFKNSEHSLECLFNLEYTYLFSAYEKRTLGYSTGLEQQANITTSVIIPWGHYILGGEHGKAGTLPLANILTKNVSVNPSGAAQGGISFAYHKNNATIDFGYSFISKEGEKLSVKNWDDNKYGPAVNLYDTATVFSVQDTTKVFGGPIQKDVLDLTTPATPAFLKHAIHLSAGYTLCERENPVTIGAGFCVNWMNDNANPTGYILWGKFGMSF